MKRRTTNLEYLLLSHLQHKPASGYDLRKQFASTPLGYYSDSPGSIYPALQRLKHRGLLRTAKDSSANARRKRLFEATPRALGELRAWVQRPITRAEVRNDTAALILRYVICAQLFGNAPGEKFLLQLGSQVQEIIQELETYLGGPGKALPLYARLAVEQGLESYQALVRWTTRAGQELHNRSSS
jgi:DNA-binding PadR family transcriptional regulator